MQPSRNGSTLPDERHPSANPRNAAMGRWLRDIRGMAISSVPNAKWVGLAGAGQHRPDWPGLARAGPAPAEAPPSSRPSPRSSRPPEPRRLATPHRWFMRPVRSKDVTCLSGLVKRDLWTVGMASGPGGRDSRTLEWRAWSSPLPGVITSWSLSVNVIALAALPAVERVVDWLGRLMGASCAIGAIGRATSAASAVGERARGHGKEKVYGSIPSGDPRL
jgi:hypothetical protein